MVRPASRSQEELVAVVEAPVIGGGKVNAGNPQSRPFH